MSFRIHNVVSDFQSTTLYAFGGTLSRDVLSPSNGNVLTFNSTTGLWEASPPAMSMASVNEEHVSPKMERNFYFSSPHYNVIPKEGGEIPHPSPQEQETKQFFVAPSNFNIIQNEKSFTRDDFVSLLGENETNNLFSLLSSIFINDYVSIGKNAGKVDGTFIGKDAGTHSTGVKNVYIGDGVCSENTSEGSFNTVVGAEAGYKLKNGSGNTVVGVVAGGSLENGGWNTFIGQSSANFCESGNGNVSVGSNTSLTLKSGEHNVVIGDGADVSSPSAENQIVIGKGVVGYGDNTITFPKNLTPFPSGTEVNFSSTGGGCLYPVSSSLRWKTDIQDISKKIDTSKLYDLRPVTYKTKIGHGDTTATHIGLVAEEVNQHFPWLVPKDEEGNPSSVRYSLLPVIVIEELKKLKEKVDSLEAK